VRLVISSDISVPSLMGWLKPMIILPVSMLTQMPPAEVDSIIAHELAHVKRHDYLIHVLQSLIEIVLFFNPFTWWLSNLMNDEREHCCDDLAVNVIGDYKVYIQALASLTVQIAQTNMGVASSMLAATGKKGSVIFRINRIMKQVNKKQNQYRYATRNFTGKLTAYFTILVFTSLVLISTGQAQKIVFDQAPEKSIISTSVFRLGQDSLKSTFEIIELPGDSTKVIRNEGGGKFNIIYLEGDSLELFDKLNGSFEYRLKGENGVKANIIEIDSVSSIDGKWTTKIIDDKIHTIKINKLHENAVDSIKVRILNNTKIVEGQHTIHEYKFSSDTSRSKVIKIRARSSILNDGGSQQPIYIINGKKASYEEVQKIEPTSIARIDVLKGVKALNEYGQDGKHGVVSIHLKSNSSNDKEDEIIELLPDNELLYYLNDKPITKKEFEKISPEDIATVDVLKGEAATKQFGAKAAKGVIKVYLKKVEVIKATVVDETIESKTINEDFANAIKVYPNPSLDLFNINFVLNKESYVKVSINDVSGKEIAIVADGSMQAGAHQLVWKATDLAKGMYFLNIDKNGEAFQQKLMLE
jgi:hypothetical protein